MNPGIVLLIVLAVYTAGCCVSMGILDKWGPIWTEPVIVAIWPVFWPGYFLWRLGGVLYEFGSWLNKFIP